MRLLITRICSMKEKLSALLIILIFAGFVSFNFLSTNRKTVLNVITPTIVQIDLNNNHIVDDNETICIPHIKTYTSNLTYYNNEIEDIPFEKGLAIGYLTDEFAHTRLDAKDVKLIYSNETSSECRFADIITENGKYSDILKNSGYVVSDGKPLNELKFNELKSKAEKLKLVIFNHKSDKYHTLTCKYGKIAHDAVVLSSADLPKGAKPCKFCHISKKKPDAKHHKENSIIVAPNIITSGNIKIILSDFTKILKPDKNCSHSLCKEFVSMTDNSQYTIDLALYGWTNIPKIRKSIENAMKRGVKVRVIYDTKTTAVNYYPDTTEFVNIFENVRSDRVDGSSKLTNSLMHNKFAVFDSQKVFTGSMNFSETGFSGFNQNNAVIINSRAAAKIYENEFEQMFNGKFHTLKSKTAPNNLVFPDGSKVNIYFSPQDKVITNNVLPLINTAKHKIYIPAFVITHKAFTSALIEAYKRGVEVKIIIDATNTHGRNSTVSVLRASGIQVKTENYAGKMHSKVVIIDDRYVVSGSTNFSNSGENKNDENMVIIDNPKIAKFYGDFFLYLWSRIPDKYLKFNPPAESKYSIGSCSDGIDNDFDGKIDMADEGCY